MKICRRDILKSFAIGAGGIAIGRPFDLFKAIASESFVRKEYNKVLLTSENKEPLKTSSLKKNENYLFFYPYHNTPVLLLNLDNTIEPEKVEMPAVGEIYLHPGGVGANKSIVAYVAICTHEFVRPNPNETLIKYYPPGEMSALYGGDNIICCCAHGSAFNPSNAGNVMQSPAEHPLTTVELEWDSKTDSIYANALIGWNPPFKEVFKEDGEGKIVIETTAVKRLSDYSKKIIKC